MGALCLEPGGFVWSICYVRFLRGESCSWSYITSSKPVPNQLKTGPTALHDRDHRDRDHRDHRGHRGHRGIIGIGIIGVAGIIGIIGGMFQEWLSSFPPFLPFLPFPFPPFLLCSLPPLSLLMPFKSLRGLQRPYNAL